MELHSVGNDKPRSWFVTPANSASDDDREHRESDNHLFDFERLHVLGHDVEQTDNTSANSFNIIHFDYQVFACVCTYENTTLPAESELVKIQNGVFSVRRWL